MIGIILPLLTIGAIIGVKATTAIGNEFEKSDAMSKNSLTYIGRDGKERLCSNNRIVSRGHKNGRWVLMDTITGQIYCDLDYVKEKEAEERAIREGETVIDCYKDLSPSDVKYYRYSSDLLKYQYASTNPIDIRTRRRLRTIYVNERQFYLDLKSGELLRISDWQKDYDKKEAKKEPRCRMTRYGDEQGLISDEEIIQSYNIYHKRVGEQFENAYRKDEIALFREYTAHKVMVDRYGNGMDYVDYDNKYQCKVLKLTEIREV